MTLICVGGLTIIGSDNDLSPGRRQAVIRTNAEILLIGHLGTIFSEILIEILTFFTFVKWQPHCLGLYVLIEALKQRVDNNVMERQMTPWKKQFSVISPHT